MSAKQSLVDWTIDLLEQHDWLDRFKKEYHFHSERRWRFDFADVELKIAIELEGGAFVGGRHTFGAGYVKDLEKYNEATVLGWRLLRYARVGDLKKNFPSDYMRLVQYLVPFGELIEKGKQCAT